MAKLPAILLFGVVLLKACANDSGASEPVFSFKVPTSDGIEARKLLYDIAIEKNLFFKDGSTRLPSGSYSTHALIRSLDGLEIILTGTSYTDNLTLKVYCTGSCSMVDSILSALKERYSDMRGVAK